MHYTLNARPENRITSSVYKISRHWLYVNDVTNCTANNRNSLTFGQLYAGGTVDLCWKRQRVDKNLRTIYDWVVVTRDWVQKSQWTSLGDRRPVYWMCRVLATAVDKRLKMACMQRLLTASCRNRWQCSFHRRVRQTFSSVRRVDLKSLRRSEKYIIVTARCCCQTCAWSKRIILTWLVSSTTNSRLKHCWSLRLVVFQIVL